MVKLFSKQQLIEMVREREAWLKEIGGDWSSLNETNRKSFILICNAKHWNRSYHNKAEIVEAIKLLDELRLARI